jgi:hypothetical protein
MTAKKVRSPEEIELGELHAISMSYVAHDVVLTSHGWVSPAITRDDQRKV